MQVARTAEQHAVMIEAVENHMPQVIVIDEIGTELEAAAARTIAERGVQLVATAHGNSLGNLLVNPTLSDLVGGIQTVTLGDEEARRRHTQKSILERKAPPTFDVVVEQQSWQELVVHRDVADTIDCMLPGQTVVAEERPRDEESGRVSARRVTSVGMDVPTWGVAGFGITPRTFERGGERVEHGGEERGWDGNALRRSSGGGGGERSRMRSQSYAQTPYQVRALAPTGTAPDDLRGQSGGGTEVLTLGRPIPVEEGIYSPAGEPDHLPIMKTLRVYPFGVSRDRLTESARQMRVPGIFSKNQAHSGPVITFKKYY